MANPTAHKLTIDLPHCWVCGARFITHGGTAIVEHHHVIPQAAGGVDGPTVSICTEHHDKLHQIAVQMKASKPHFHYLQGEPQDRIQKLLYLANAVHNAFLVTKNDPNKAASVTLTLKANHKEMVDQLKTIYPRLKSREAIFLHALESLHSRHFGK